MSGESGLERRYRRLLAWYPPEHRRQHEEEMLGVLMTGARPGQRRPGFAESASLIWGAMRVRLRPGLDSAADPGWRDALAVLSVLLPVSVLFGYGGTEFAAFSLTLSAPAGAGPVLLYVAVTLGLPLLLTTLVLLRLRRTAALATAGLMIWIVGSTIAQAGAGGLAFELESAAFAGFILGPELAALLASPGPRRGLQILSWRYRVLVIGAAATIGAAAGLSISHPAVAPVVVGLVTIIAIGMAVASPLSRRILVLLAIPFCSTTFALVLPSVAGGVLRYLPSVVISCLAIVAIRRSAHNAVAAASQDS